MPRLFCSAIFIPQVLRCTLRWALPKHLTDRGGSSVPIASRKSHDGVATVTAYET